MNKRHIPTAKSEGLGLRHRKDGISPEQSLQNLSKKFPCRVKLYRNGGSGFKVLPTKACTTVPDTRNLN